MTDDQIIEALAEKVMGWQRDPEYCAWSVLTADGRWSMQENDRWNPLENWSDVGMVIEAMEGKDYHWQISGAKGARATAIFLSRETNSDGFRNADAPRRAICLAALEAVGVEVT